MRALRLFLLALCVLLMTACSRPQGFDAGKVLSAEEMAALQSALREEQTQPPQEAPAPTPDEAQVCYYTAGGSVWHLDAACYHLSKSKNVITATVREAIEQGKTKVCSNCGVIKEENNG